MKQSLDVSKLAYKRVLLKLSGEALQGDQLFGIDTTKLARIIQEISQALQLGVQIALVIGGGNIIRGSDLCAAGFDRISADQMGMLSTVINGIAIRDALEKKMIPATLMSAFAIAGLTEQYNRFNAMEKLTQGKVVILSAGTGNPLVTTDSAAALRGIELNVDIVLKATKVEGVFNDDPIKNPNAERYLRLSFEEIIAKRLGVMDLTAILMCQDHNLPLRVFNMNKQSALKKIVLGEDIGTIIKGIE